MASLRLLLGGATACRAVRAWRPSSSVALPKGSTILTSSFSTFDTNSHTTWQPTVFTPPYKSFSTTNSNCINFRKLFIGKKTADEWRASDGLGKDYNLIYQGGCSNYIWYTLATVEGCGVAVLVAIGGALAGLWSYPLLFTRPAVESVSYLLFFAIFSLGTGRFAQIYPIRIYYSEEDNKFKSVFFGSHPFSIRVVEVLPGQARKKRETFLSDNVIPWAHNVAAVKGQHDMLLIPHNFQSPVYYNMMFGH